MYGAPESRKEPQEKRRHREKTGRHKEEKRRVRGSKGRKHTSAWWQYEEESSLALLGWHFFCFPHTPPAPKTNFRRESGTGGWDNRWLGYWVAGDWRRLEEAVIPLSRNHSGTWRMPRYIRCQPVRGREVEDDVTDGIIRNTMRVEHAEVRNRFLSC